MVYDNSDTMMMTMSDLDMVTVWVQSKDGKPTLVCVKKSECFLYSDSIHSVQSKTCESMYKL